MKIKTAAKILLAALLVIGGPAFSADKKPESAPADKTTIELVQYFLKVPTAEANAKLIEPFLAVKPETLPKKLRGKTAAKQAEIGALLRLHDTKKGGSSVRPAEGCSENDFVKPLSMLGFFAPPAYADVTEDELKYVMDKTRCTEIDLGCKFSLMIFFEKKKERRLRFLAADPIMAIVAESQNGGGGTHFFGSGLNCQHY